MTKTVENGFLVFTNQKGKAVLKLKQDTKVDEFDVPGKDKSNKVLRVLYPRTSSRLFFILLDDNLDTVVTRQSAIGMQSILGCSNTFTSKLVTFPRTSKSF